MGMVLPVSAFVHVHVKAGKVEDVLRNIKEVGGVKEAYAVTGEFDIIAKAEADDLRALGETVTKKIQGIDGVSSTVTSVIVA